MIRLLLVFALAMCLAPFAAHAQDFSELQQLSTGSDYAPLISNVVADVSPQVQTRGDETVITHNASQDIVPSGVGVMCPTPPTSIWREFDLAQFGIDVPFELTSVDIGIRELSPESAGPTTVRLYTLDGDLLIDNLSLVTVATLELAGDEATMILNVEMSATFAETDVIVLEWEQPVANIFFGGNSEGESSPTYLTAPACGANEPTWVGDLGDFDHHQWVANLRGILDTVSSEDGATPNTLAVSQTFPNPVIDSATIQFTLREASDVRVTVFDTLGREVAVLANATFGAGDHSVSFDVDGLSAGMYIYRVSAGVETVAGRMMVAR